MMETRSAKSENLNGRARDSILDSIRNSLAASAPFDAEHQKHHQTDIALALPIAEPIYPRQALIDDFRTNLELVGGHCSVVASQAEAIEAVRSIIEMSAAKHIAVSDSPLIRSVINGWNGVEFVPNTPVEYLFASDIGITGAQWAIAETGTLVLVSDAERHRLTSLVPPVHVCLLKADTIRQTLGEILELTRAKLSPVITFITGASRTSDIELTLAIGVHGPGELHVIVIT